MAKPFDTTTKHLLEVDPGAWLDYLGLSRAGPVDVIDADLASVIAEADKVLRINDPVAWLVHIEFQATYGRALGRRLLEYNVLLGRRHDLPVLSVLVLLRPEADGPELTGVLELRLPNGERYHEFRYRTVRVWEQSVERILSGGLGTLPLAPVANVSADSLPNVVRRMNERFSREANPSMAASLWTSTYFLMGLRYPDELTRQLLRGVPGMKESSTYQAVLAEGKAEGKAEGRAEGMAKGKAEEARLILIRLGSKRFGSPDAQTRAAIETIAVTERLEELTDRLLDVSSWTALLATH